MTSILSSNLRSQCGQIALKKTVLHLSLPVPEKGFVGTAMLVLADGKYYRQSESWIDGLKNKYGYAVKIISDNAEKLSAVATQKPVAISLGALVIGAALLAALSSSKGKAI